MKKIVFTAFLAALGLTLTSCPSGKGGDEINSSMLIGTWKSTEYYYIDKENGKVVDEDSGSIPNSDREMFIFDANGTATYEFYSEGQLDGDDTGSLPWRLAGDELILGSGVEGLIMNVEKLTSTTLVLSISEKEVDEGVTYESYYRTTYVRVD